MPALVASDAQPFVSPAKAAGVFVTVGVLMAALVGRVAYLQTYGRERIALRAEGQQHQTQTLPSRRGGVFDSTGMLMAGTIQTQALFVDPKFMQERYQDSGHSLLEMDDAITRLADLIDRSPADLAQLLSDRSTSRFVKVAEHLDEHTVAAIEKLDIPGTGMMPQNERYYPMGSIAAHLLGGCGRGGAGLEGLEMKFEKVLAGKDGSQRVLKDARRRAIAVAAEDYVPPEHGRHLIVTIDGNIQMIAEQELAAACAEFGAKRGEVVVMDPRTGDVLALANWPTFNPQDIEEAPQEVRLNRAIVVPYEPGSTIKPFIAGPAMSWNVTRPNEVWPITTMKWATPYGRKIEDTHHYGPLCTWDVLVKSSNIGMSMLGERMGNERLYTALRGFGFGRQTGIDLPGEDPGQVHPLKKWTKYSTESVSQGYELMVTPLQLARGFCCYANGGRLVTPRVVKGTLDAAGNVVARARPVAVEMLPQVVDPITAAGMKRILSDTLVRGTATKARSRAYNIFGKTGTAHISQGAAGYSPDKFNSSFLGGAPAEQPKLVIAMTIHEPAHKVGQYFGGTVSAPAAGRVLERSLAYLQTPESPDLPVPPANIQSVMVDYHEALYTKWKTTPPPRNGNVEAAVPRD